MFWVVYWDWNWLDRTEEALDPLCHQPRIVNNFREFEIVEGLLHFNHSVGTLVREIPFVGGLIDAHCTEVDVIGQVFGYTLHTEDATFGDPTLTPIATPGSRGTQSECKAFETDG